MKNLRNERESAFSTYTRADIAAAEKRALRSMERPVVKRGKRKMTRDDWETVAAQLLGVAGLFAWGHFIIQLFRSI